MTGLNIALIGYGKMGKTIEKIAKQRGHKIGLIIDIDQANNIGDLDSSLDVAIEFTRPEAAVENLSHCIRKQVPVVSGTTGWLDHFDEIKRLCLDKKSALFYASNYSIGVNIFFAVNQYLAKIMNSFPDYEPTINEIHHTQKLDAPSGTAITLGEGILKNIDRKNRWKNEPSEINSELEIISERIDDDPGTHIITYDSEVDYIKISHHAKSRQGFGLGAVMAAEWLVGKSGCFGMEDMLKIN
ncbi:MAG: 4-hydroxy-tetrahydrodipicolinate reductase [Saprospiraceae bacterium]|nr:4-hydroxy-tetrahydrodipicolinate reductase [Saprospiraceae bacterium]